MSTVAATFIEQKLPTYNNATNARRAIGRSSLSQEDKDKVRQAIDKKFGEAPTPAATGTKKVGKKAGKKVSKKLTPPPPGARVGKKKTSKKVGKKAGKKVVRKASTTNSQTEPDAIPDGVDSLVGPTPEQQIVAEVNQEVALLGTVVATAVQGVQSLDYLNQKGVIQLDVSSGVLEAGTAVTNAMRRLNQLSNSMVNETPAAPSPEVLQTTERLGSIVNNAPPASA